jgi:hypothetical protein
MQNNNPTISLVLNDGKTDWRADLDGQGQAQKECQRPIRNPSSPTLVRITYLDGKISVR